VIGADQVAALGLGDRSDELGPGLGEEPCLADAVEPVELGPGHGEQAAQHQRRHPVRVALGVEQRQGRPPGAAEELPAADPEIAADPLDVLDQVPGGVVLDRPVRPRTAGAALVEEYDEVPRRIEEAAHERADPGPGPPCSTSTGLLCGAPQSST